MEYRKTGNFRIGGEYPDSGLFLEADDGTRHGISHELLEGDQLDSLEQGRWTPIPQLGHFNEHLASDPDRI